MLEKLVEVLFVWRVIDVINLALSFLNETWRCHSLNEDLAHPSYHSPFRRNKMDLVNHFRFPHGFVFYCFAWFARDLALFSLFEEFDIRELKHCSQNVSSLKGECITLCCGWRTNPCLVTLCVYKSLRVAVTSHYWWYILRLSAFQVHKIGIPSRC